MPASLIVCVFFLPLLQLLGGAREIAWRHLRWALGARILATPLGVALVAVASADAIALTVGVLILVTVAASVWAVDIRLDRRNSALAGAITGRALYDGRIDSAQALALVRAARDGHRAEA